MALCEVLWQSKVLKKKLGMNVILPEVGDGPFDTLYLLHGLSDDYTVWARRTRIEWYVRETPLIVVMPDGGRGWYTDNERGPAWGRYMGEEVVGFVERNFPAKREREGRHIGGLAMGGYGALRLAMRYPDVFGSAHSHSGALFHGSADWTLPDDREDRRAFADEIHQIFGTRPEGSSHDVLALARSAQVAGIVPRVWIDCGTEDFLIEPNRKFHQELDRLKIAHEYREYPGAHVWDYWDQHIREAIEFHLGTPISSPALNET